VSGSTDRLPRLLALVPYLRSHGRVTLAELAEVFGVPERRIEADLRLLWLCGLPGGGPGDLIDLSFVGDGVELLDPQTLDRPLRLTADEGVALLTAARALAAVPGLPERDALDRVVAKLGDAVAVPPVRVEVALEPDTGTLAALRRAQERGRRVHLRYLVEGRDEVTDRDVDPMRLLAVEGRWYLEGWCRRVEDVRLFRLDRVVGVRELDVAAAPPPEAAPRNLADGLFRPSPADVEVRLELAPAARWVADYYPVERVEEGPDGGLLVTLRTPDPGWVRRLALRLAGAGRVLAPPELAAQVQAAAAEALRAYEE
jgi:proteasome accessory factor C